MDFLPSTCLVSLLKCENVILYNPDVYWVDQIVSIETIEEAPPIPGPGSRNRLNYSATLAPLYIDTNWVDYVYGHAVLATEALLLCLYVKPTKL